MSNNLKIIEEFFSDSKETLLIINDVNEEINSFYHYVFKFFAQKKAMTIQISENETFIENDDLFGVQNLYIWNNPKNKLIENIINSKNKNILFVNYSMFKKIKNNCKALNAYQFNHDVKYFINHSLNIKNQAIIDNITNHPVLTFSEISKFAVNSEYIERSNSKKINDNFLDQRKKISDIKKEENINILKLFNLLKDEVLLKKFNFLVY